MDTTLIYSTAGYCFNYARIAAFEDDDDDDDDGPTRCAGRSIRDEDDEEL
jgi:hypothetical protein